MTDLYPDEEGYIDEGSIVGFCKAAASISLHGAVKLGLTGVSNYISVIPATVNAGVGIALKAADTNDYIPVAFRGIVKQTTGGATFSVGQGVCASGTTAGVVELFAPAISLTTLADSMNALLSYNNLAAGVTTRYFKLGNALQPGTTAGDEVLIMLAGLQC